MSAYSQLPFAALVHLVHGFHSDGNPISGTMTIATTQKSINTPRQVLFASLVGTTIEFFDFYIYATAAVLVFPQLFFPATDPAASTLLRLRLSASPSSPAQSALRCSVISATASDERKLLSWRYPRWVCRRARLEPCQLTAQSV